MKFDPAKPCRAADGGPARVICTDAAGKFPIIALILTGTRGEEIPLRFTSEGFHEYGGARTVNLVNIPEKKKYRVYLTPYGAIGVALGENQAERIEKGHDFDRWISDWVEHDQS